MRQSVVFPNPFCTPQLSTASKSNCHVALSRIPRSMIGVDENLCLHSPIVPNRCGRVSELRDEYGGDRAHLMSVLLPPDQVKNAAKRPDIPLSVLLVALTGAPPTNATIARWQKSAIPGEIHSCFEAIYKVGGMWGPASTVFAEHGGIESTSPPSYLPLAWGGTRDGEDICEQYVIRGLRPRSPQHANGVAGADHENCGSVGKPACSLLEVRAPDGNHLEAKLPAMDKNRATEAS